METYSIFHFFARLMERRGYFIQDNKLEDFDFPEYMIAAESSSGFPDFVLKSNEVGVLTGGEMIELKDTRAFQIASFNSTLPTATKPVSSLTKKIRDQISNSGENLESLPIRDVYYLVRGILQKKSHPLSKTILVSGAFFETMPVDEVLTDAFHQVANDSMPDDRDPLLDFEVNQRHFATTRRVEQSSISVRFRVMAQADPRANLLNESNFPEIKANTLTLLVHAPQLEDYNAFREVYPWHSAPSEIQESDGFVNLESAYKDIDKDLESETNVSVLRHPLNGPFFLAQSHIYPQRLSSN